MIDKINLSKPKSNLSWEQNGLNEQNLLGNIFLNGVDNVVMKKKIGKNKFKMSKVSSSPLTYKDSIFLTDDTGTIFNINKNGKLIWKRNIYKKVYKKIYKHLTLSIYNNDIYVADNIGLIYSIDIITGNLSWLKNHGVPLKSKIRVYENKIFLINQDNRILSLSVKDGSVIWDIRSIPSFIKSQNFLSLAISKDGDVIASTSSGDLIKINSKNGMVYWSINTLISNLVYSTDFFKSSEIVISGKNIIFSTQSSIFSFGLSNGYTNWEKNISSIGAPIIVGNNIFFVTENGYFIILNLNSGELVSSTYILKNLKNKKQLTKITGFVMGSGNIYSVTRNGYLIKNSAYSGKTESFKKISNLITSSPIISNGKLFVYTENSKILVFN